VGAWWRRSFDSVEEVASAYLDVAPELVGRGHASRVAASCALLVGHDRAEGQHSQSEAIPMFVVGRPFPATCHPERSASVLARATNARSPRSLPGAESGLGALPARRARAPMEIVHLLVMVLRRTHYESPARSRPWWRASSPALWCAATGPTWVCTYRPMAAFLLDVPSWRCGARRRSLRGGSERLSGPAPEGCELVMGEGVGLPTVCGVVRPLGRRRRRSQDLCFCV
jgi:hypothetical protein